MHSFERRYVLGVPVDLADEEQVVQAARAALSAGTRCLIVTVNAEFVVKAQTDPAFRDVLEEANIATPDGAGVVWALRRRGILIRRLGGSDLIWSLSALAAELGLRVFYLGAEEGVAEEVARRMSQTFPQLRLAGAMAGSPKPEDDPWTTQRIAESGAKLVFAAYGAPEQELWLARNSEASGAVVGIGVGGSFNYVAGRARRAPKWMRDHGMDWLWRFITQPWRWRRMLALPRFVALVLTRSDAVS